MTNTPRENKGQALPEDHATAAELVSMNKELLLLEHDSSRDFDRVLAELDRPPVGAEFVLAKNHPAFTEAMNCTILEELVDYLVLAYLRGRRKEAVPEAFTHITMEAARELALHAIELDKKNVEDMILARNDSRISEETPTIYPGLRVATIPILEDSKAEAHRNGFVSISDPRHGALKFQGMAGGRDPFAPIILLTPYQPDITPLSEVDRQALATRMATLYGDRGGAR